MQGLPKILPLEHILRIEEHMNNLHIIIPAINPRKRPERIIHILKPTKEQNTIHSRPIPILIPIRIILSHKGNPFYNFPIFLTFFLYL